MISLEQKETLMAKKAKRLGRVIYSSSYVVDIDNQAMVDEAIESVLEDITNAVKLNEVYDGIKIEEDETLKASDIPSFLKEKGD